MKTILIITICLALILFIVYVYFGGLRKIKIEQAVEGGETIVYEEIKGDYKKSGVVMDKIYYSLLNNYKIETYKGFGIYYDNPKKTATENLRSEAGCIIEEKDIEKLDSSSTTMKIKTLPVKKYIVTEFPYRGKLSVLFSLMKVYPALNKYSTENGFNESAIMEIYDIPNKRIRYRKDI